MLARGCLHLHKPLQKSWSPFSPPAAQRDVLVQAFSLSFLGTFLTERQNFSCKGFGIGSKSRSTCPGAPPNNNKCPRDEGKKAGRQRERAARERGRGRDPGALASNASPARPSASPDPAGEAGAGGSSRSRPEAAGASARTSPLCGG